MANARFDSVWGKLPPSLRDLSPAQMRALDRYVTKRVVERCYRIAYDSGFDAAKRKYQKKRRVA